MTDIFNNINNVPLLKVMLIFYIFISNSSLHPLMSKQWNKTIEDNRIMQHIVGLVTMITIVTLASEGKSNNLIILLYSVIGYLWFILSTKMDIHWIIMIMILLLIGYLYENSLKTKELLIDDDKVLTDVEKYKLKEENDNKRTYLLLGILGITLIGVFMYSNKKNVQYGGGYNLINFLIY